MPIIWTQQIFLLSKVSRPALGIPSLPGVQHLVHEANHTPPSSAKVKNEWNYTTNLQYAIMTCTGTTLPLILSLIT